MKLVPRTLLSVLTSLLVAVSGAAVVVATTEVAAPRPAYALDDGLALTPPMGFNNWNTTHCRNTFNEQMIKEIADLFVEKGLKDAGYEYVNIDDCWALPERDPTTKRLVPDPARFPNGIKSLADYVHSKGLKFGIYTSAGTKTCNRLGFPGSLGYEEIDAQTFADWGVDYLKYDNCNNEGVPAIERYTKMRDALKATGRPIVYSICEWGENQPWEWGAEVGHLWRTTGDISDSWGSMLSIMKQNAVLAEHAGPGHWNDPDMLEVGNGGMTDTEYRSHFSLWAIMAAPLLIGSDLRNVTPETFDILLNREVIAVDQDPRGIQGRVISRENGLWVFAKPLSDGDVAVALFNENSYGARISTSAAAAGLPRREGYVLRDLWRHSTAETAGEIAAHVPAHGTVMYRVSADPDWGRYPPATSLDFRADSPASGSAGQYIVPGEPVEISGSLANHGRLPAYRAELSLAGPTSHEGVSYEAEAPGNTLSGGARVASCGACSGGQKVGFIGNGADSWARFEKVNVHAAGRYRMAVHALVDGVRSFSVSVNGGPATQLSVTGTSWSAPVAVTTEVTLQAGANTVRFFNDTAYAPDLDKIVLTGQGAADEWNLTPAEPVTTPALHGGQTLSGDWSVTPPETVAPGVYELTVTASYQAQEQQHRRTASVRLVVPSTGPLATGYLSDQPWLEARNGWGPVEIDRSNGETAADDGGPISINGVRYAKGLGAHAPGEVMYFTGGDCSQLVVDVGLDDEIQGNQNGSVSFEIWADSAKVADSGVITWRDPVAKRLTADIAGASFVRLVVTDAGDGNHSDHADWADAQVTCAS